MMMVVEKVFMKYLVLHVFSKTVVNPVVWYIFVVGAIKFAIALIVLVVVGAFSALVGVGVGAVINTMTGMALGIASFK